MVGKRASLMAVKRVDLMDVHWVDHLVE